MVSLNAVVEEATSKVKWWHNDDYQHMGLELVQLYIHSLHRIFQLGAWTHSKKLKYFMLN